MPTLQTETLHLLGRAMDAYSTRTKTLATNISNIDTPGYERMSVSFEDELREARHRVNSPRSTQRVHPQVEVEARAPVLEDEMMELADTQMRNQFATRALREEYGLLQTAITGRPASG